ncbi:MAG: flagellar biosynthetic protein FliO, partial [Dehalococcoidia bacterium]|nr:flagellar biosynthetic protein FliO [Dehalococcoidia bacterium]
MRLSRITALIVGAASSLLVAVSASAQEAPADAAATDDVGTGVTSFGFGDWVNLGVRLALVVAVIWGAVYAMRWYVRRMNRGGGRGSLRALEVLETHALGPNRTLHLVRLGDRAVLVGATQERITQLLTVDDPDEFKRLTETPEDDEMPATPRVAGAMSLISSLGSGLRAMRTRQAEMNARIKAQREAQR